MTISRIMDLLTKNNVEVDAVETKPFGTIVRAKGLTVLDQVRLEAFSEGWKTPISCHREEGSCEAFMILWNA